jgi:hypothetical protein
MSSRHATRTWLVALAIAGTLIAPEARAGEPRLDEVAAARGIAAGELGSGVRVKVPAGSRLRATTAERRSLTLHGLPLRGAFETIWQVDGEAKVVAARYPSRDAAHTPAQVQIDLPTARARAGVDASTDGELVYALLAGQPVLAWELVTSLSITRAAVSRERVWVSAIDGRVLERVELVDADRLADVYAINPVQTPHPSTVTLGDLDPDPQPWTEGGVVPEPGYLTGNRVRVFNCIDAEDGPFAPWRKDGECWPTQRTRADENGDYFVPVPDVSVLADNKDPTDLYAELSMYYHAEQFFAYMAELGVDEFPCELSNMVANFHWLEPAPNYPELEFGPLNNAYYSGTCDIEKGPTMLFGQGSEIDFAFDGDVVYHELGHGIVQQLTPEGLRSYAMRADGVLSDATGINEAIADYHTLMLTDDPGMGNYAGFYWSDLGRAWIRYADNEYSCPRDMVGQPHYDSEPLTAALWSTRRRVGGAKLDPVVLASLPMLASDATHEDMSAALLMVAGAERDAGIWTDFELAELERALAARGLIDCERIIDNPIDLDDTKTLYLRNEGNYVSPFWPGPVQFRQRIPAGSDNLLISFEVSTKGNSSGQPVRHDVYPLLLVKRSSVSADAPLTFAYEMAALGHHDGEDGDINQTWEVSGDWDEIVESTVLGESRRQFLLRGLTPGEVVHVSFANTDSEIVVMSELAFASVPSDALDNGSPDSPFGDDDPAQAEAEGGCVCTSEPGRDNLGGAAALLLLALVRRRSSRP